MAFLIFGQFTDNLGSPSKFYSISKMVQLGVVESAACVAWSPSRCSLLATGTVAGAFDFSFSDSSSLSIHELRTKADTDQSECHRIACVDSEAKFSCIDWVSNNNSGIIAGGLENGKVNLWDAQNLIENKSSLVESIEFSDSSIKALKFNRLNTKLLSAVGGAGVLMVWDFSDNSANIYYDAKASRDSELTSVAWNNSVTHIIAAGGSSGYTTIWELKSKKEIIHLANPFSNSSSRSVSAIEWHPSNPTKIASAYEDGSSILVWDLRNARSPEKVLQGHELGVLDISWCSHDPNLLLSSGKDNKTILWDPNEGQILSSLIRGTNWSFQTAWSSCNPDNIATASYDAGIAIHSIQTNVKLDNDLSLKSDQDFFSNLPAVSGNNTASLNLERAPAWLCCPMSVRFDAEDQLLIAYNIDRKPNVVVHQIIIDSGVADEIKTFEDNIDNLKIEDYCQKKIDASKNDSERKIFQFVALLINQDKIEAMKKYISEISIINDAAMEPEEIFENLSLNQNSNVETSNSPPKPGSDLDSKLTDFLLQGDFDSACKFCLEECMFSNAFLFSQCASDEVKKLVKTKYIRANIKVPSIRLFSSISDKNFDDIIMNSDINDWKKSFSLLCTFASPNDFSKLISKLGEKLQGSNRENSLEEASICYIAGSDLEHIVDLWLKELKKEETKITLGKNANTSHSRNIVKLVEKVTILRKALNIDDHSVVGQNLSNLIKIYCHYSEMLIREKMYDKISKYLDLIPKEDSEYKWLKRRLENILQKRLKPTKTSSEPMASSDIANFDNNRPFSSNTPCKALYNNNANIQQKSGPETHKFNSNSTMTNSYKPERLQTANSDTREPPQIAPPKKSSDTPFDSKKAYTQFPNETYENNGWNDAPILNIKQRTAKESNIKVITSPFPSLSNGKSSIPPPPLSATPIVNQQEVTQPFATINCRGHLPESRSIQSVPTSNLASTGSLSQTETTTQTYIPVSASESNSCHFTNQSIPLTSKVGLPGQTVIPTISNLYNPYAPRRESFNNISNDPKGNVEPRVQQNITQATSQHVKTNSRAPEFKYPAGNRDHIPPKFMPVLEILSAVLMKIRNVAPKNLQRQLQDIDRRLGILFDLLNNQVLLSEYTKDQMLEMVQAISASEFQSALTIHIDLITSHTEECGQWMIGVKRLIELAKMI